MARRCVWRSQNARKTALVQNCPVSTDAETVELHIVSDSTGETAARLVQALEAQFPDQPFEEIRHPRVESVDELERAVARRAGRPAVMFYTLVEPELRDAMRQLCRRARVHYCDLLGHPIDAISRVAGRRGARRPGAGPARRGATSSASRRSSSPSSTTTASAAGLDEADVVLVGVSRTSKTPLSMYLGYLGYKAANVPIVRGIEPPQELFEHRPGEDRRADDRPRAARGDPPRARSRMGAPRGRTPSCSRSTRSSTRPRRSTGGSAAP